MLTAQRFLHRSLQEIAERGQTWQEKGTLFTQHCAVKECTVHILWDKDCDEPWCLATSLEGMTGSEYKLRVWQEESFRDLKSAGWQWQSSLLRNPEIAERVLLPMALAYTWCLSLGIFLKIWTEKLVGRLIALENTQNTAFFGKAYAYSNGISILNQVRYPF